MSHLAPSARKQIGIDRAWVGAWIMDQVGGYFAPGLDHSIANFRGDDLLGGFALCNYMGGAITAHMAGKTPRWCSRELMWMVFDYAFNQLGVRKVIAPVRSDDHVALALDLRAGFTLEAVIRDAMSDGAHLMLLTMTREQCPWLNVKPRDWRSGSSSHG